MLEAAGLENVEVDLEEFASKLEWARVWYRVRMDLRPGASKRKRRKKGSDNNAAPVAGALGFGRKRQGPFEWLVKRLQYPFQKHLGIAPTLSGNSGEDANKKPNTAFIRFVEAFLKRCNILWIPKGKAGQPYTARSIVRAMSYARQANG
jgi:hypothetical protein